MPVNSASIVAGPAAMAARREGRGLGLVVERTRASCVTSARRDPHRLERDLGGMQCNRSGRLFDLHVDRGAPAEVVLLEIGANDSP